MNFPILKLNLDIVGRGEISIDDKLLPVDEMTIHVMPGKEATTITLTLKADVKAEIEAMLSDLPRKREMDDG